MVLILSNVWFGLWTSERRKKRNSETSPAECREHIIDQFWINMTHFHDLQDCNNSRHNFQIMSLPPKFWHDLQIFSSESQNDMLCQSLLAILSSCLSFSITQSVQVASVKINNHLATIINFQGDFSGLYYTLNMSGFHSPINKQMQHNPNHDCLLPNNDSYKTR